MLLSNLVPIFLLLTSTWGQVVRTLGPFQEVFAWKQITFNIDGNILTQDTATEPSSRQRRQSGVVFDGENDTGSTFNRNTSSRPWGFTTQSSTTSRTWRTSTTTSRPSRTTSRSRTTTRRPFTSVPQNNSGSGWNRPSSTTASTPSGIPSTLNYLLLDTDSTSRSPPLRPYPNMAASKALTSVYRTRADECGRLWMVDTGLLEIPNNRQQVQPPAIVIYDLNTDQQILRYNFKTTDIPSPVSPTGLASITVDIPNGDCSNAYAYVPELATYGLIVYSLRDNDSWRLSHNFFSYNPLVGNLNIAGQRFQWNDGVFSITLAAAQGDCRDAYFHAMVGTHEFVVSTCALRNRTASEDSNFWSMFEIKGNRGDNAQSTMHGYHPGTNVVFFADIARSAISCWNTGNPLTSANVGIIASDSARLSYPSDLHVTGDEVWVMANSLPTWAYSRLDTNDYNFFVYRGQAQDLIRNTVCQSSLALLPRSGDETEGNQQQPLFFV